MTKYGVQAGMSIPPSTRAESTREPAHDNRRLGKLSVGPMVKGVRDLGRILGRRPRRQRMKLTHEGRRYLITYTFAPVENALYGEIHPVPALRGTRESALSPKRSFPATAAVEFKRWMSDDTARFNSIVVPTEYQRQGEATRMVEALFAAWPHTTWWNSEALNEMSGPLFLKLHKKHPDRLRRPYWPQDAPQADH